jgi:hypothetical protein
MLDSVSQTIGVEFESIVFDNREKHWGLCKVYNHCAAQAKYPYLCFLHEDVLLTTPDWGKIMTDFVQKTQNCGIIGFAGGRIVPRFFISWYSSFHACSVSYRFRYHDGSVYYSGNQTTWAKVVALDGLFLFCEKQVWSNCPFDEQTFTGFHLYDADFCFSAAQKYQNYVCMCVDIIHKSRGNNDRDFYDFVFAFQKKWKRKTPVYMQRVNRLKRLEFEVREMLRTYDDYKKLGIPLFERYRRIIKVIM